MLSHLLHRREEDRHDTSYTTRCRVGVQCGESHPALELDQFAHGRHRGAGQGAVGTMKHPAFQGAAV